MPRRPVLVGLALAAIRLVSIVVPRRDRDGWRREWEGEILHRHVVGSRVATEPWSLHMSLVRRSFGSIFDAAWLRRQFTADSELVHDARHATRLYRRSPGMLALVVLVLAAGIGSATAVLSAVDAVFFRRLPFGDADALVTVWQRRSGAEREDVSPANFLDWRDRLREVETLAGAEPYSRDYVEGAEPETFPGARVTEGFFDVFRIAPARGRLLTAEDYRLKRNVVIVSHGVWTRRFGGADDVIGREMRLDGEVFEIVGVLPADFEPRLFGGRLDVWTPKATIEDYERRSRGGGYWHVVGRIRSGRTLEQLQTELDAVSAQLAIEQPRTNERLRAEAVTMREHLSGGTGRTLTLLGLGSAIIFFLALGSVANLQLGLLSGRLHEFAVRSALGAHRARLVRQVFVESLALSAVAVVAGAFIAMLLLSLIRGVSPDAVSLAQGAYVNGAALVAASLMGVLAAVLAAVLPVLTVLRSGATDGVRGALVARGAAPALYGRSTLVVIQLALALVLLVSAGLLGRSLLRLQGVDAGLQTRNLLALQVFAYDRNETAAKRTAFFAGTIERIRVLPGVEQVGAASTVPFLKADIDMGSALVVQGRALAPGEAPRVFLTAATPDYFQAAGIPLRRGRTFTHQDTLQSQGVAVVNDTAARLHWPGADPIGHAIEVVDQGRKKTLEIVGVVGDVRYGGLEGAARPEVFLPHAQSPSAAMTYVIRTRTDPASLVKAAKQAVWSVDPLQTFYDAGAVTDMIRASLQPRIFVLRLVTLFAVIGVIVAVAGAYGAVAWALRRRTSEFGVRMALGASAGDVRRHILGYAGRLALSGIVIGLVTALVLGGMLRAFLFDVDAADPLTLVSVSIALLAAVLLASTGPARRASRIDPAGALRVG